MSITCEVIPSAGVSVCKGVRLTFSCQLNRTLMVCPPPSALPLEAICEKPVACGVIWRDVPACPEPCPIPLYLDVRQRPPPSGLASHRLHSQIFDQGIYLLDTAIASIDLFDDRCHLALSYGLEDLDDQGCVQLLQSC